MSGDRQNDIPCDDSGQASNSQQEQQWYAGEDKDVFDLIALPAPGLELQGEHGDFSNEQPATDKCADKNTPFHAFKADTFFLQAHDERTPEKSIGRGGQCDEAQGLTLVEVELGKAQSREGRHHKGEERYNRNMDMEGAEVTEYNGRWRKPEGDIVGQ